MPRILWSLLPPIGRYGYAALFHDFVYWQQTTTRLQADQIFRDTMTELQVSQLKRETMYWAVRLFGFLAWRSNAAAKKAGEKRILKDIPSDVGVRWGSGKRIRTYFFSESDWNVIMATVESCESWIALVIGNADYSKMRKLKSTRADADEIASALAEVGFTSHESDAIGVFSKLTPYHNQTQQGMNALLADFSIASQDAEMAVIYYSGHGIEIESRNFLIPTDAELRNVASVVFRTIALPSVTDAVAGARKLRLVILDACRECYFRYHRE